MTTRPPEALQTTKRKFHTLLNNLTASPASKSQTNLSILDSANASTTSLSSRPETPIKRLRVSDVDDMARQRTPSGESPSSLARNPLFARNLERTSTVRQIGAGLTAKASPSQNRNITPRKAPNYVPYNHEAFLARLKTFVDVRQWTSKPDRIGEVEWAKRGWICEAWNTVACKGGCEARVVVMLRPKRKDKEGKEIEGSEDMSVEVDEALVEKYVERMVEGHAEGCLWRRAGCKADIYHMPILRRDFCESELLRRYQSFKPIEAHLPPAESITYPGDPADELIKLLPPTFLTSPSTTNDARPHVVSITKPPSSSVRAPQANGTANGNSASIDQNARKEEPNIIAFAFALFGWSGIKQESLNLATCNYCFQRIGLWLYTTQRLKEMSQKLDLDFASLRLNLLDAHREHCPWKNGDTQANSSDGQLAGEPGWKTLQWMIGAFKAKKKAEAEARRSLEVERREEGEGDGGEVEGTEREKERTEKITETWRKLKSKLKRSTSRKSLKSVKSVKSSKSGKSVHGE